MKCSAKVRSRFGAIQTTKRKFTAAIACAYLSESGWSITEIAFSLGFADMSSFSRAFRRWTGSSPTAYAASLTHSP